MKRWAGLVLLIALQAAAAEAADPGPWRLGNEPLAFTLDNGLPVVLQRDDAAPITVVQLLVRGGDRDDPPGLSGLAYLTSRLSLEIPDQAKLRQLMDFGSSFHLSLGGDTTLITVRSLSRHLGPTLGILSAILREPLFSDLRIDAVKEMMRHLQKAEEDDPGMLMRKAAASAFYDRPAYGAARFGDNQSLARIGKKEIRSFFRGHFLAGNMVAVVISDLPAAELRPLLGRQLGVLDGGNRSPAPALTPSRPAAAERSIERRSAQTHVSVSVPLPPATFDNLLLAWLMENWLGRGIGSRLWRLRSRGDLAYGLSAELHPNREGMIFCVHLQTGNPRAGEARAELSRLLLEIQEHGIGEAELEAAKAYARADFWRENESRERRAAFLAFLEGTGHSHRLAGDFPRRLAGIGLDEFNAFLREALEPERWISLQIGPGTSQSDK
ncbi:MAG: insulinase family protein [Candidatus Aminicenantes bacterium]|nr:insulinase family protein [Candidatus Aminicenantes bacterium]